jgi:hypothetical protein
MADIKAGDFVPVGHDNYSDFDGSMADRMDRELDRLMRLDDPLGHEIGLSLENDDKDVRARRRLFVAIARGIVLHLKDHQDGLPVTVSAFGTTVNPDIQIAATAQSPLKP